MTGATVQAALQSLVGLPLGRIGRAADLLWVQFGALRELPGRNGGTKTVGEWALHIQCPWRVTLSSRIVIARGDCFRQADSDEPYDWDATGESRFDRLAAHLNHQLEASAPRVVKVAVDAVNGFSLDLDGGYTFDVFPAESTESDTEHWRFFQPGMDGKQLIFESGCLSLH